VDSFTAALSRLDPASRALLDLSLRRGMRPEEISELLGTDPESVIVAREGALEQLASELGMDDVSELDDVRARLAELPAEAWTGQATNGAPPKAPETAARKPEPEPARRSRLPLLLTLLAIAAVVLVVILASSGGDANKQTASSQPSSPTAQKHKPKKHKPKKPAAPKPAPGPKAALTPLGKAGGARGTAALTQGGKRLVLHATGLRSSSYQVWLYDSVIEATSLTKVHGTKFDLDLKLPRNASHYRYLDVSLEPPDGNPNHSGESVLRVPLSKLSR
jgi:hypothetical protein